MLINDEPFERGQEIAHYSGMNETGRFIYHGRAREVWANKAYHILSPVVGHAPHSDKDTLYLLTDAKLESYHVPGTHRDPERDQLWKHRNMSSKVLVLKVVDDLVIYDYVNDVPKELPVHYCRSVDDFREEFRYIGSNDGS